MKFDQLSFSAVLSQQRIQQAQSIFGSTIVRKILTWALFLLGARKSHICSATGMKPGSLRSLLYRLNTQGLGVLEDRRSNTSVFQPHSTPPTLTAAISQDDEQTQVKLGNGILNLQMPSDNSIQLKVVLLTMLHNRLVHCSQVASILHLSEDRTMKLTRALFQNDVNAVIDQRQGQQKDYRFTPEIKGELIQQFVLDLIQEGHTNATALSRNLRKRSQHVLSPRSILVHINKLGLCDIKETLTQHLEALKKTKPASP